MILWTNHTQLFSNQEVTHCSFLKGFSDWVFIRLTYLFIKDVWMFTWRDLTSLPVRLPVSQPHVLIKHKFHWNFYFSAIQMPSCFSVHMITLTAVFMLARQSWCPPPVSLALLAEGARLCDGRAVPRVSVIMWLERERKDYCLLMWRLSFQNKRLTVCRVQSSVSVLVQSALHSHTNGIPLILHFPYLAPPSWSEQQFHFFTVLMLNEVISIAANHMTS